MKKPKPKPKAALRADVPIAPEPKGTALMPRDTPVYPGGSRQTTVRGDIVERLPQVIGPRAPGEPGSKPPPPPKPKPGLAPAKRAGAAGKARPRRAELAPLVPKRSADLARAREDKEFAELEQRSLESLRYARQVERDQFMSTRQKQRMILDHEHRKELVRLQYDLKHDAKRADRKEKEAKLEARMRSYDFSQLRPALQKTCRGIVQKLGMEGVTATDLYEQEFKPFLDMALKNHTLVAERIVEQKEAERKEEKADAEKAAKQVKAAEKEAKAEARRNRDDRLADIAADEKVAKAEIADLKKQNKAETITGAAYAAEVAGPERKLRELAQRTVAVRMARGRTRFMDDTQFGPMKSAEIRGIYHKIAESQFPKVPTSPSHAAVAAGILAGIRRMVKRLMMIDGFDLEDVRPKAPLEPVPELVPEPEPEPEPATGTLGEL